MHPDYKIIIAGAGGIGRAVGLFLTNYHEIDGQIYIGDKFLSYAEDATQWIAEGTKRPIEILPFTIPESGTNASFNAILKMGDILLDCLPGGQAPRMARFAREHDLHYVNLTEYIKETNEIVEIAKGAETGFILQAGLAPGFVNILAHHLFNEFCNKHQVDKVEKILMRVGALTEHSRSPHFYGFTWSPVGVATEYVKDTVVVRNYEKMNLPALSDREKLIIDGDLYEADLTSGGAADMPDSFEKRARFLDYKTIRYPGHYDWVSEIMKSQHDLDKKIEVLQTAMLKTIPAVEEDLIIIYVSVVGKDKYDRLRAIERSYKILPKSLGGQKMRAIQATTAAPMAECARMLLTGEYRGPVFQSQINPDSFMKGPFVDFVYGSAKREIAIVHGVW